MKRRTLWILLLACVSWVSGACDDDSGSQSPTDADIVGGDTATGDTASGDSTIGDTAMMGDTATGDTTNPGACNVEPHCSLFRNHGEYGGEVRVSISADGEYAIVETNALPDHATGPYGDGNPNQAAAQDFTWTIPLSPSPGPADTPLGPVAVMYNGATVFNPSDARDYAGCTGNAGYIEVGGLDAYGGHPERRGVYHYHAGTFLELADELGLVHQPDAHSSLLGFAPDGYPIYGPWGYSDPMDAGSGIELLASCFELKAQRDCCTDEFVCGTMASSMMGNIQLGMGAFLEDFEFVQSNLDSGSCDLNEYNMRFQVTPEYPDGTWAYIVTVGADGEIAYPYMLGLQYYGAVANGATPGGGGMMPPPPMP